MKIKLFIVALFFALVSCSGDKLDMAQAKTAAEGCLTAIDKEEYPKVISDYYASELGSAEPAEELTNKFKKLKEVTGPMQSFEFKEGVSSAEMGQESAAVLTYSVKHERVTTTEKFTIIIESGKYKVSSHDIKNE